MALFSKCAASVLGLLLALGGSGWATAASAATSECANYRTAHPEWIWCDDFEQDRMSGYFEYSNHNGFVPTAGAGLDGSVGMKATYKVGDVNAGGLKLAFGRTPDPYFRPVDDGTKNYRELYWRVYMKNQSGWTGGDAAKFTRAIVFVSGSWAEAMIAHLWGSGSGNALVLDPASGTNTAGTVMTTGYNDFDNMRWLGSKKGATPMFDADHVGKWYCVEAHVKLNDASQSNGIFEFWIDEKLEARTTGLNWLGSYNAYGLNALFFENYWNSGPPVQESRYWDNIVVSTQPIGCGPSRSGAAPAAPGALTIR
jgi:hypothetical protein